MFLRGKFRPLYIIELEKYTLHTYIHTAHVTLIVQVFTSQRLHSYGRFLYCFWTNVHVRTTCFKLLMCDGFICKQYNVMWDILGISIFYVTYTRIHIHPQVMVINGKKNGLREGNYTEWLWSLSAPCICCLRLLINLPARIRAAA